MCGKNKKSYQNSCKAKRAGVKVAYEGKCKRESGSLDAELQESDMEIEKIVVSETGNPSLRGGAALTD